MSTGRFQPRLASPMTLMFFDKDLHGTCFVRYGQCPWFKSPQDPVLTLGPPSILQNLLEVRINNKSRRSNFEVDHEYILFRLEIRYTQSCCKYGYAPSTPTVLYRMRCMSLAS
jgi:hypothetical protein